MTTFGQVDSSLADRAQFGRRHALYWNRPAHATVIPTTAINPHTEEKETVKIVILDGRPLSADRAAWSGLDRLGEVEFHEFTPPEEVPARGRGAAILVTNKAPIREPLIESSADLRFHHGHGDRL